MFNPLEKYDIEEAFVLWDHPNGIVLGLESKFFERLQSHFALIRNPTLTEGLTKPSRSYWGYGNCLRPYDGYMFDSEFQKYSNWIFWQYDIYPMNLLSNMEENPKSNRKIIFKGCEDFMRTVSLALFSLDFSINKPDLLRPHTQFSQIALPQGFGYSKGARGFFSIGFSSLATKYIFSKIPSREDIERKIRQWKYIDRLIFDPRECDEYEEESRSHMDYFIDIFEGQQRYTQNVFGNCACMGDYVREGESTLYLTQHNVDTLEQSFAHLYGISMLWRELSGRIRN